MFDDLLSPEHLIVLGIVALLIFGPKRLPELGSGLGQALRGFRDAVSGVKDNSVQNAPTPAVTVSQATQKEQSSEVSATKSSDSVNDTL